MSSATSRTEQPGVAVTTSAVMTSLIRIVGRSYPAGPGRAP
jgi:hypothetical protein